MEKWIVEEVHCERETSAKMIETHTIACESVLFTPTASPSEGNQEGGTLRVLCRQPDLMLPWDPTRVRFKAQRYIEERLFEVGSHHMEANEMIFMLTSPSTGVDTNSSDGHITSFHSSDSRK